MLVGQGILPGGAHALAHLLEESDCQQFLAKVHESIAQAVHSMPSHADFVARHCAALPMVSAVRA